MLQGRCGSFFGSTTTVEDEYSRVIPCVDEAEKAWRLFDIWDRHFDKLPVISAKLSLRVTSVDKSGKEDWPMVSKQAQLLRKLAPL
ncbi:hypothetical protein FF2_046058 [Malus domestica]